MSDLQNRELLKLNNDSLKRLNNSSESVKSIKNEIQKHNEYQKAVIEKAKARIAQIQRETQRKSQLDQGNPENAKLPVIMKRTRNFSQQNPINHNKSNQIKDAPDSSFPSAQDSNNPGSSRILSKSSSPSQPKAAESTRPVRTLASIPSAHEKATPQKKTKKQEFDQNASVKPPRRAGSISRYKPKTQPMPSQNGPKTASVVESPRVSPAKRGSSVTRQKQNQMVEMKKETKKQYVFNGVESDELDLDTSSKSCCRCHAGPLENIIHRFIVPACNHWLHFQCFAEHVLEQREKKKSLSCPVCHQRYMVLKE
ncbi:hypothetical protein TRFO_32870 [Tritrichomonas foetus]|uniref:RING-type domain-containing protein n=1 Tax=Tritrichomonas foetus TaxID=1144522 RepID=A0A1J4JSG3_9EUKA|nr:hypothetical protein TRFO_32870 [Tritrichomonas foetus]|eukprot:OHT00462.1 hypothetical protein TRFO_32870 [Tritrichomonas foetus]